MNVFITYVVFHLKHYDIVDLSCDDSGHDFVGVMVSFLIVARSQWAIDEYFRARFWLSDAMKASREVVQHVTTFTRKDQSPAARNWRLDVTRRTVAMLRTLVAFVEVSLREMTFLFYLRSNKL